MSLMKARGFTGFVRAAALGAAAAAAACAIDDRTPVANEAAAGSLASGDTGSSGRSGEGLSSEAPGASGSMAAGASGAPGGDVGPAGTAAGADGPNVGEAAASASTAGSSSAGAAGAAATGGAGSTGAGEAVAPCSGCVELSVPVNAARQAASFQFVIDAPGADFSDAVVRWRVRIPEENTSAAFYVTTDLQNGPELGFAGLFENYRLLTAANFPSGQWVDLVIDVSTQAPAGSGDGFDPRAVEWVALTLGTTDEFEGDGMIRVLVDSVAFEGVAEQQSVEFTSGVDGLELNRFEVPEGTGEPIHHP